MCFDVYNALECEKCALKSIRLGFSLFYNIWTNCQYSRKCCICFPTCCSWAHSQLEQEAIKRHVCTMYINIEQMTEIRVTIAKRISFTENYNEIFSMTSYAFSWLIFLLDTNDSHNPWREDKTMTNFLISDGKGKIPSVKSL